jgi:hypothetical protein
MIAVGDAAGIAAGEEATEIRRRVQPNERAVDILPIEPADKDELYREIKRFRPHVFHSSATATLERWTSDRGTGPFRCLAISAASPWKTGSRTSSS